MYALFLETEAAQQIDRYAEGKGLDAEEIKRKCYTNAVTRGKDDNWWFERCIKNDAHKHHTVDSLFTWSKSPEGHDYWRNVQDW